MRIISNFYDYYDSFNDNESLTIYKRITEEIKKNDVLFKIPSGIEVKSTKPFIKANYYRKINQTMRIIDPGFYRAKNKIVRASIIYVLIAKNLYPIISAMFYPDKLDLYQNINFYNVDDLIKFTTKYPEIFKSTIHFKKFKKEDAFAEFEEFFKMTINEKDAIDLHLHYNSPIISWSKRDIDHDLNSININPRLKEYGMEKILDPFNAYQEISQFYETYLIKEKEVPVKISDIDKIHQHGFDKKTSFRKM